MVEITEDGRLIKIINKNTGKTIWDRDNEINRSKISQQSRQDYRTAVNNGDWKKAHSILFHILTGEKL